VMATDQAKMPRSVRKGPLITVTCECGQRRDLRYGEVWRCEGCGRRFDTNKIPLEEYAAIRRTQLRYRLFPLAAGLILLAAMVGFFIAGRIFSAVVVGAFLLASWGMLGRPFFRSRYRKKLRENLPTWNLKAD
jgi:Flp pilus assembly protein TadB